MFGCPYRECSNVFKRIGVGVGVEELGIKPFRPHIEKDERETERGRGYLQRQVGAKIIKM